MPFSDHSRGDISYITCSTSCYPVWLHLHVFFWAVNYKIHCCYLMKNMNASINITFISKFIKKKYIKTPPSVSNRLGPCRANAQVRFGTSLHLDIYLYLKMFTPSNQTEESGKNVCWNWIPKLSHPRRFRDVPRLLLSLTCLTHTHTHTV